MGPRDPPQNTVENAKTADLKATTLNRAKPPKLISKPRTTICWRSIRSPKRWGKPLFNNLVWSYAWSTGWSVGPQWFRQDDAVAVDDGGLGTRCGNRQAGGGPAGGHLQPAPGHVGSQRSTVGGPWGQRRHGRLPREDDSCGRMGEAFPVRAGSTSTKEVALWWRAGSGADCQLDAAAGGCVAAR